MSLRESLLMLGGMLAPPPGYQYGSVYAYFAAKGQTLVSCEAPDMRAWKYRVMRDVKKIDPEPKQCFANAQRLVLEFPERYTYFEGFVMGACVIPIHHGWVIENWSGEGFLPARNPGALIDPTMRHDHDKPFTAKNLVLGVIPEGWEYFGLPFSREKVLAKWRGGWAGSIVDDHTTRHAELRGNGDGRAAREQVEQLQQVLRTGRASP
jgi:hypothetical protein